MSTPIRVGRHCVSALRAELVFLPKRRSRVFTSRILTTLRAIFERVCLDFDAKLVELDGSGEYVRLVVEYPPKVALASLVNSLKGVSSRLLRREPGVEEKLWDGVFWSPSYFVGSCAAPGDSLARYLEEHTS